MSDYVIINGELYHHGIKGMKWGQRKAKDTGSAQKVLRKSPFESESNFKRRQEEQRSREAIRRHNESIKNGTHKSSVKPKRSTQEQLAAKMQESGRAHTAYSVKAAEKEGRKIRDKEDWRSYSRDLYKRDPEYKKLYDTYEQDLRAYRDYVEADRKKFRK